MKELRYNDGTGVGEIVVRCNGPVLSVRREYATILTRPPYSFENRKLDWSNMRVDPEYGCDVPTRIVRQLIQELDGA